MLKYTTYDIVFQEIPGETTLAINISNCPHHCPGCHSPELWEDIGEELTWGVIMDLYRQYPHITCIALMGGDANIDDIIEIGFSRHFSSMMLPSVKLAWYSGLEYIENEEQHDKIVGLFDYIKMGPYIEEKGPLNNPNTNQRMYETFHSSQETRTRDITHKFWKTYEGY